MAPVNQTNLVIGRGELYFGQFAPGTMQSEGELYLGNTPGFSVTRTYEQVERSTSYGGQQIQQESYITRERHSANLTTDNISMDNLALWFGGTSNDAGQLGLADVVETLTVKRGRHYQLGTSYEPFGARHIEPDITFTKGGVPLAVAGNLVLRREDGRFYVSPDAIDIVDDDEITAHFQWRSSKSKLTEPKPAEVIGSLRFISQNPHGPRKNYFFPYVRLQPSGAIDLKSDQWQQFIFDVEIRRLNPAIAFFYVIEVGGATYTADEQAIVDLFGASIDDFPAREDLLNTILNLNIPAADYGAPLTLP